LSFQADTGSIVRPEFAGAQAGYRLELWRKRIKLQSSHRPERRTQAVPPEQRGLGFALYGVTAIIASAIGPTLAGWITDNYSCWISFINLPVGNPPTAACLTPRRGSPWFKRALGASLCSVQWAKGDNPIMVFTPDAPTQPSRLVADPELSPLDLAIAPNGNIVVSSERPFGAVDAVTSVREYDATDGHLVRFFSSNGKAEFRKPRGLRFALNEVLHCVARDEVVGFDFASGECPGAIAQLPRLNGQALVLFREIANISRFLISNVARSVCSRGIRLYSLVRTNECARLIQRFPKSSAAPL
jgi:hypothetical protein